MNIDGPSGEVRHYALSPLQQRILDAEKYNKDCGIYFTVNYAERWSKRELEQAIQQVMNAAEAFGGRVVREGSQYLFAVDAGFKDYRSPAPLNGHRLDVFGGGRLAAFYLREEECCIEFLMHHLVVDRDSLYLFLEHLEQQLLNGTSPALQDGSYFRADTPRKKPEAASGVYADEIRAYCRTEKAALPHTGPVYGKGQLTGHAFQAADALSGKLKVTRFGVLLLALVLLAPQRRMLAGVVVSRRDQLQQAGVIGNFTDVVPVLLEIDGNASYAKNARRLFKKLFQAIGSSAELSYGEYMDLLDSRSYDLVLSYTRMQEIDRKTAVFSQPELKKYLHNYSNYLQFNEYETQMDYELCYEQPCLEQICGELKALLLKLNQLDLSQPVDREQRPRIHAAEIAAAAETVSRRGQWFPDLDEDENLFDSTISSMDIARMITDIYEYLGVQLSYQDIYASGTLRKLKRLILERACSAVPPQADAADAVIPGKYACPNFMKPLFIDSFQFENSTMYDVKYACRISGQGTAELNAFQAAVEHVIDSNDIFFTEFSYESGEVKARVSPGRHVEIEHTRLDDLEQMNQLRSAFRLQGGGKLWDIRLITVLSTQQTYLYLNMHHILLDHTGLGLLLSQIEHSFNGTPVHYAQYGEIARSCKTAIADAVQGWQPLLRYNAYPSLGKPDPAKGSYHTHEIAWRLGEVPFQETERRLLASITNRLAPVFHHTKGYVGAVYHGRVVPGASKVIQSFAKVLPIFFNTADKEVLRESLETAHLYQAASIYDLNSAGFTLECPPVVFQTRMSGSREGELFDGIVEFGSGSKYQILINLELSAADCRLKMYIDDQLYSPEEAERMVEEVRAAVQELKQKEGTAEYA